MLIALAVAAVVIVWLIFSVLKKVVGFVLLIALAAGAWILWSNPEMLQPVLRYFGIT